MLSPVIRFSIAASAAIVLLACSPSFRTAPDVQVPMTEAAIARGQYLADSVIMCLACHSPRDWSAPGAPVVDGMEYAGGLILTGDTSGINKMSFPGTLQAPNITQHAGVGIGSWTDGEILRATREGVDKQSSALFPLMPYANLRLLTDRDAYAIVAYLRTLEPIESERTPRDLNFPVGLVINFLPEPLKGPVAAAPMTTAVERGKYLAAIAGCGDCHTPLSGMKRDLKRELAGGNMLWEGGTRAIAGNLTPDLETGYGEATEEQFFRAMREGIGRLGNPLNAIMPWYFYRNMSDQDLHDLWAYLRSLPPVTTDLSEAIALLNKSD